MGMKQFGGGKLGGVALQAGGMVPLPFTAMPTGPISALLLVLSFTLISTAGAFNLVVDTGGSSAAEGTDDLDIFLTAMMPNFQLYADPETSQGNFGLTQWRTWLGFANKRDFEGTFANGVSVPASNGTAKSLQINIPIPYSLKNAMPFDGDMFHQGSTRLKTGRMEFTSGSSLTPNLVLANGTATVGAMAVNVFPFAGAGTENDVGALWQVTRPANTQTIYDLDPADYLFVALQSLPSSIGTGNILIGPYENWPALQFDAVYQADQLTDGGYDITTRCTPLLWSGRHRRFQDFLASVGETIHADLSNTSLTSGSWILAKLLAVTPALMQRTAQVVGAGGSVSIAPVAPPSGQGAPALLSHLQLQRIVPGAVSAAGVKVASPGQAAVQQGSKLSRAAQLTQQQKNYRR